MILLKDGDICIHTKTSAAVPNARLHEFKAMPLPQSIAQPHSHIQELIHRSRWANQGLLVVIVWS